MIVILAYHFKDVIDWSMEHKFNAKNIAYSISVEDCNKLYGLEINSIVTLPSFYKHTIENQHHIFRTALSRMRL